MSKEHAMKLYKERFSDTPEGQDNLESHYRRHEVIKTHCCNIMDEWGVRVGLSSYALGHLKDRFAETADIFIKETLGASPEEMSEGTPGEV